MKTIRQQVLEYLQTIPKGKVTSYKNIAKKFGIHPRAVAGYMRGNKEPNVYPCYKVVSSDGKLSGYTTERGVPEKIERLEADGVIIVNGKVDPACII